MNYIELIEDYYGEAKYKYIIIPTPLFDGSGYGPRVCLPEGEYVYNVLGPSNSNNGIPSFGRKDYFRHILLHEFSHSFVNPITEKNIEEINKSSKLFAPIEEAMKGHAYSNW